MASRPKAKARVVTTCSLDAVAEHDEAGQAGKREQPKQDHRHGDHQSLRRPTPRLHRLSSRVGALVCPHSDGTPLLDKGAGKKP